MTPPGCWVPGQIGNALAFDGTNDFVQVANLSNQLGANYTISWWAEPNQIALKENILLGTDSTSHDFEYYQNNANLCVRADAGSSDDITVTGVFTVGQWVHICGVGDANGTRVYVNGTLAGTTGVKKNTTSNYSLNIGAYPSGANSFNGTIDDVRLYSRALTATEIAQLANIPTYRGFSEGKAPSDSNMTIVIPKPSGTVQNDLLIAAVAIDEGPTSLTASGWTPIDCTAYGTAVTLGTWRKTAGASEPASYNFSWTGGQKAYGWIMRFTGYDATSPSPINTSAAFNQSGSSSPTSPAVTTTVPNCLILRLGAFDNTSVAQDNPNLLSGHTTITADSSGSSDSPTFQAAGTAQSGTGAITVAWPAHQAGDIALLFVESCGGQAATLSTPAGFANVTNSPQATGSGTNGTRITVFWCRATSSSMSSPTVADPGNHVYGRILTFRNVVATGNPWDVTAGGTKATASTTTTFGAVTTSVDNTLIVLAASRDNDSAAAAWSGWTNANLSSLTERSDEGTTSGNGGGVGVATGVKSTAGGTGQTTATVTSSVDGHMTIALKPAGSGTVSGGAGYVKQSSAGDSGQSNFQLTAAAAARMLTIAIAPAANGSYDCCGDYIQP